jgi:hypothetical protein
MIVFNQRSSAVYSACVALDRKAAFLADKSLKGKEHETYRPESYLNGLLPGLFAILVVSHRPSVQQLLHPGMPDTGLSGAYLIRRRPKAPIGKRGKGRA